MIKGKLLTYAFFIIMIFALSACANNTNEKQADDKTDQKDFSAKDVQDMHMVHSSSGEVPEDLKKSENPAYPVGNKAIIETDHMPGMKGAEATIVGAYDTTAYIVSYTPTNGGKEVKDHKWVVQEELKDQDGKVLDSGTGAILNADHMEGMKGAKATIDGKEETTVYMIDYVSTTDGEAVKNHQWVTDSELSPK